MNTTQNSYNKDWTKKSKQLREKYNCNICGENSFFKKECHHIDLNKKNDNDDNLIVLCSDCHTKIHRKEIKLPQEMETERKKIEDISTKLEDINKLISPYQLAYVSPTNDCIFLEKNAHFMEKAMLDKLTSNIESDGFLSQLPFSVKQESGKYLIISGNHRLKASIKAGLEYILILYVENISKDKQLAYQLSHNSLVGQDDINILKAIYQEIETLEGKEFAGLNGLDMLDIDNIKTTQINDVNIELTEIKFLFLESRGAEINKVLEVLEKSKLDENSKIVYGDFSEFIKVLTGIKAQFGIKSNTVAFGKMIEVCEKYIADHTEEIQFKD